MPFVPQTNNNGIGHLRTVTSHSFNSDFDVENPEWYNYLGFNDEAEYNREKYILQMLAKQNKASINIYYLDDESSKFFGYSYEEILAMHEGGTDIPDEVLNWAMIMAQNNPTVQDIPVTTDDAEMLYLTLKNSPNNNLKTIATIFSNKCNENSEKLKEYSEELVNLQKDISVIKDEIEIIKEDAKRQIASLKDEWEDLSYKLRNGIPLTEEENERANALKEQFEGIDENYKTQVKLQIFNISFYVEKISEVTKKLSTANSYVGVTKQIISDIIDTSTYKDGNSILTPNGNNSYTELAGNDITADFMTALQGVVDRLDTDITDVDIKAQNIQNIMEEISEIGGFQLDDPNHEIKISMLEYIDFSVLDFYKPIQEDEEPEEKTGPELEDLEDITLELPADTEEPNPELGYNPNGGVSYDNNNTKNFKRKTPYITAPSEIYNQAGNNNKKR